MDSNLGKAASARRNQLRRTAEAYFKALAAKDFEAIPYSNDVVLRAPVVPGGVHKPLVGRDTVRRIWWSPLVPILGKVTVIEHYFNERLTAVVTEAEIHTINPAAALRIADHFTINDTGEITEQENHFDPRDVTNPGWQTS